MLFRYRIDRRFLMLVCVTTCLMSCGRRESFPEKPSKDNQTEARVPNDFFQFYTRFHADSAFQMDHIAFPLEGLPANPDSSVRIEDFRWLDSEWKLHRPLKNDDDQFIQAFNVLSDGLVIETISDRNLPISMQRRFARMADGWNLIYYVEMQLIARSNQ